MKRPSLLLIVLGFAGAWLAGCNTVERRAQERSYVFNTLDPQTQQRLQAGEIRIGDTFDMVYIALGAPEAKRDRVTAEGTTTVWVYASYRSDYEGRAFAGYRRQVVYDPRLGGYRVIHRPVTYDVYSERRDERFRVTFRDGLVTTIESNQS